MTGIIATIDIGPRAKEIYDLLERCSEEIDGCELCNLRHECDDYCETHLYSFAEISQEKYIKHMANITQRRKCRRKLRQPAARECRIEFPNIRRKSPSLICAGGGF